MRPQSLEEFVGQEHLVGRGKPLRDASYKGAQKLGCGIGYLYPHDFPDHYVPQTYLPPTVRGLPFYEPTEQGNEKTIAERLRKWQERRNQSEPESGS